MTETVKIVRTRAYLLNTSTGDPIQIDEEEVAKVVNAVATGSPVVLKRGVLLNPNHGVTITADKKRIELWLEDTKYDPHKRSLGMKPLAELIDRAEIVKALPPAQRKLLGN